MAFRVPAPVAGATEQGARGCEIGGSGWRLVEVRRAEQACEQCGQALRRQFIICDADGRELAVGRRCVKELSGWDATEAEARRKLEIAERDRKRAEVWARFAREFPADAAMVQADVAAYERQASSMAGAGASHEIRDHISDFYAKDREWVLEIVARYRRRRAEFWWVRNG